MKIEIDTVMVKDLLNLQPEEAKKVTLESIAKATSQYFKIPMADLKSKARSKNIAKARHIAMYLSRKIVGATQQEIGRFYGGRDHSSVIHAVRAITEKIKKDAEISRDVLYIETEL
jgi:chromosomal replication initiator protein